MGDTEDIPEFTQEVQRMNGYFDGNIQNIAIFNRVLSKKELQRLFKTTLKARGISINVGFWQKIFLAFQRFINVCRR